MSGPRERSFIGQPVSNVPSPAFIVRKSIVDSNVRQLNEDVATLGISFRPHVKTLKTVEVTRLMLADGLHRKSVASTLSEIRGLLPLVREGLLDECLYGIPVCQSALPELFELRQSIAILLMIDNEQHLQLLQDFNQRNDCQHSWSVFIKVDVGSHRAGLLAGSVALTDLVQRAEASPAVSIHGFYCHAGHAYACRNPDDLAAVLQAEVHGLLTASELITSGKPLVLSVGATPTAHVVRSLLKIEIPDNVSLELHAGNYVVNDLQQLGTGATTESMLAARVLAEVCSVYPDRNEALINAGTIALSKETGPIPGFGRVCDQPRWKVVRMTQEHGILGLDRHAEATDSDGGSVDKLFRVGQKVFLYCQHACITSAAFHVYYAVDDNDVVQDVWIPWRGW